MGGRVDVLNAMHGRSRMTIDLTSLQCRDGAPRGVIDQADTVAGERGVVPSMRPWVSLTKGRVVVKYE